MEYVIFALVGLVVGVIAKLLVPGNQGSSIIMTSILGMIGSVVGTVGGQKLGIVSQAAGTHWWASIAGAAIVVFIYGLLAKR